MAATLMSLSQNAKAQFRTVVSWENVVLSSVVVGALNFTLLIFWILEIDLITLFIYSLILILVAGLPISKFSAFGRSISEEATTPQIVSKESIDKHINFLYNHLNNAAAKARNVFLWQNTRESLIVIGALFLIAFLSPWFSFGWFVFFAANGVLLKKPISENYIKHVHPKARPYLVKAKATIDQVVAKLPTGDGAAKAKKI